ncbi:MAG: hypothetical protein RL701_3451 [Pseudomonadota bacterium]|jgi:hypothetical protein
MRVLLRALRQTYLTVDPRSLGLFRVGLGLVLLLDAFYRYQQLDFWYTNAGLLPNHTLLWRPPATHVFSLFFVASSAAEATLGFALCACVYLLLTVGYRTRAMQWLALICRVSLNSRLAVLENGGDMVLNLLCCFTLAMPLGRRFSIDAWLAGAHTHRQRSRPVVSLAMLALLVQFAAIYFFNAISKQGAAWHNGTAVHYALHLDKFATELGVWMREQLPLSVIRALSWGTLVTEWTACVLLITPIFRRQARTLALVLLPCLHLGFGLGLHLGIFSPAMMAFYPLLLDAGHWRRLERLFSRRAWFTNLRARSSQWRHTLQLSAAAPTLTAAQPTAAAQWRARVTRGAGELAVAVLLVAVASEALNDNASVPAWLRPRQPGWAKALVEYPRLLQGWRMFAPEPSSIDSMTYVDAITSEGKHVDPYNLVASREPFPAGPIVPRRMGQSQFFTMYSERIAMPEYANYRQAFSEWLLAYPERTHNSADCLISYAVYYVTDVTPAPEAPPDQRRATPREKIRFMDYTAPADGRCHAAPPPRQQPLLATSSDAENTGKAGHNR